MPSSSNSREPALLEITPLNRENAKALSRSASARLHYNLRMDFKNPDTGRTTKCPPRDSVLVAAHFCVPSGATPTTDVSSATSWFSFTDASDKSIKRRTGRDFIVVHPLGLLPSQHIALSKAITQAVAAHLNTPTHGALHCRPGLFTPVGDPLPITPKRKSNTQTNKTNAPPLHPNPHTHATTSDRDIHGKKLRDWGNKFKSPELIDALRLKLERVLNQNLKMAGLSPRYAEEQTVKAHGHHVSSHLHYTQKSWRDKINRITSRAQEIMTHLAPLAWLQEMRALLTRGRPRNPTPDELRRLALAKKAASISGNSAPNFHSDLIGHLHKISRELDLQRDIGEPSIPANLEPRL